MARWLRCNKSLPCPVCQKFDWCRVLDAPDRQGNVVVQCTRTSNSRMISSKLGEFVGYLWRIPSGAVPMPERPEPRQRTEPESLTPEQIRSITRFASERLDEDRLSRFSTEIGISAASLKRMYIGWHPKRMCWIFPMVGDPGFDLDSAIGIRTRLKNGDKRAVAGSHNGLFVPSGLSGIGPLLIEEGPTSTGALLDMGFDAIGRPFVPGGVELIRKFIRTMKSRLIVVVANNDEAKKRPDGTEWFPGQEGGAALAQIIAGDGFQVKMILPIRSKDSRRWLIDHKANYSVVMAVIGVSRLIERSA